MSVARDLKTRLESARKAGDLRDSAVENIQKLIGGSESPLYGAVIGELLDGEEWAELNDRFFRTLAFGTGGFRGRSIGKVVTELGRGAASGAQPPPLPRGRTQAREFLQVRLAILGPCG